MKKNLHISMILFSIMMFCFSFENAEAEKLNTTGKDFLFTFPPNFHNFMHFEDPYFKFDSLYIFIASQLPTSGEIIYFDKYEKRHVHQFNINDPSEPYRFAITSWENEMEGYNNRGDFSGNRENEIIRKRSFRVLSDEDVAVYAHSQANMTSDAFNIYPVKSLGQNYLVMAYPTDKYGSTNEDQTTPSQFVIVASEDDTKVSIYPSAPTQKHLDSVQKITLDEGEVYLVQAYYDWNGWNQPEYDLTGTRIKSDKPVAVFSGHQRTGIPLNQSSRDFLIQQMIPVQAWGNTACVVPVSLPTDISGGNYDEYRILAHRNNTELYFNDTYVATLDSGEYYEDLIYEPFLVEASGPIMCGIFKSSTPGLGDPFFIANPTLEQYGNFYYFSNIQASGFNNNGWGNITRLSKIYNDQFITIISPKSNLSSLELNDVDLDESGFVQIGESDYYFKSISVKDGANKVTGDEDFTVLVYGYGKQDSYGYISGMSLDPLDITPPTAKGDHECFKFEGTMEDTIIISSNLKSLELTKQENINNLNINGLGTQNGSFSAELDNIYEDGSFAYRVKDSAGLFNTYFHDIPGFTVAPVDFSVLSSESERIFYSDSTLMKNRKLCFEFDIVNYGSFEQYVDTLIFSDYEQYSKVEPSGDLLLQPGESVTITVCFKSDSNFTMITSLMLSTKCTDRFIADFDVLFGIDKRSPSSTQSIDDCNEYVNIQFTDSTLLDIGLMSIDFETMQNIAITKSTKNRFIYTADLAVQNPYEDAIYRIVARDSAENESVLADTIQGFTLGLIPQNADTNLINMGERTIGALHCDTLTLHNYGMLPFEIENAGIFENIEFSVPPSQFPMVIEPGSSRDIAVCFKPVFADGQLLSDTVWFDFNCLRKKVPVQGMGDTLLFDAAGRCEIPVQMTFLETPADLILSGNDPDPASEETEIEFAISESSKTSITIYDIYGNEAKKVLNSTMEKGVHRITVNVSDLPSGAYFYEIVTGRTRVYDKLMISR